MPHPLWKPSLDLNDPLASSISYPKADILVQPQPFSSNLECSTSQV
jgi:hypothetical protein